MILLLLILFLNTLCFKKKFIFGHRTELRTLHIKHFEFLDF